MSKKDKLFSYILFFFGIVLFLFTISMLIYQIVRTVQIDWSNLGDTFKDTRNYVIVEFITIIFKLVISLYAMVSIKHLDEALNPLFTFTCLYFIFVILQSILFFSNGGLSLGFVVSLSAILDMIISIMIFGISLSLKFDDWRSID